VVNVLVNSRFFSSVSWKKMLNLRLLFKYIVIEHIVADCVILWNVLNYQKNETCDVNWLQDWCERFEKVKEQWVGMVRGLYPKAIW
jgi:hypothetical protein